MSSKDQRESNTEVTVVVPLAEGSDSRPKLMLSTSSASLSVRQGDPSPVIAGRYRIEAVLGRGGMGAVYRARDLLLEDTIALKRLQAGLPNLELLRERFRQEVKLGRRVTHPNVARTFDIGIVDQTWFLTMELIEGQSLASFLRSQGQLSRPRALKLMAAIARTLEAVHGAGIVHCDLKPENLMLTPDNRVILTDFGLARLAFTGVGTRSSMVLCTPAYAPPELVAGVSELDYRADLFSFGVMLYQVLADRQPWSTERSNQPASFFCDKPPDPIGGDIPPEIERLVVSLLAESPSDRPGSAAEVARTLERHVASTVGEVVQNVRRSPPRVRLEPVLAPEATPSWILEGLTERLREGLRRAGMTSRHGDQVDAVVEATLISGEGLELSLQVTSFADGLRLWSGNIISSQNDLVALCDQALATLVETLFEAPIVRTSLARSPDVEAQELHLRGRYVLRHFWFEDVSEAITYLEQAHERAPEDPAILVDLAVGLARHSELSKDNALLLDRAWMLAIQARDSAPQWADSWLALAMVAFQAGRWSLTLQHARYALSLEPDLAAAHELIGTILAETGPLSDARWHFVRALQLDDQLFRSIVGLWRVEALLGNSAQARQTLTRLEAMEGVLDWARIIERRHYIWFDPERARRIPITLPPRGPAEAVQAFSACLEAFSQSAPLPQEALDGFFSTLENAPRINRQQLINAQGIIEMLAGGGGSWEQAYPLLKILASAGLRDLMWLAHAPVFAQWRLNREFQGIEEDLRRRTT